MKQNQNYKFPFHQQNRYENNITLKVSLISKVMLHSNQKEINSNITAEAIESKD